MNDRLQQIRASEEKAHTEMYSNNKLYQGDNWLKKPIKTVQELMPLFSSYKKLRVLDLGCGIGRNCIEVALKYKQIDCKGVFYYHGKGCYKFFGKKPLIFFSNLNILILSTGEFLPYSGRF